MIQHKLFFLLGMATALFIIVLDQLSKWYVLDILEIWKNSPINIASFFNLVMVWNHGISFGMLSHHRLPWVLIALALVIIVVLVRWLTRVKHRISALAIGLVIGGAIGNVIDRIRFGAVFDFLDFHAFAFHWPAFNVADSAIFIGVVVLCFESMIQPAKKPS